MTQEYLARMAEHAGGGNPPEGRAKEPPSRRRTDETTVTGRALLESIDLVTFDCFGTLVDWAQALPALGVELDRMPVFLRESERRQRPDRRDAPFVPYR